MNGSGLVIFELGLQEFGGQLYILWPLGCQLLLGNNVLCYNKACNCDNNTKGTIALRESRNTNKICISMLEYLFFLSFSAS